MGFNFWQFRKSRGPAVLSPFRKPGHRSQAEFELTWIFIMQNSFYAKKDLDSSNRAPGWECVRNRFLCESFGCGFQWKMKAKANHVVFICLFIHLNREDQVAPDTNRHNQFDSLINLTKNEILNQVFRSCWFRVLSIESRLRARVSECVSVCDRWREFQ